MKDPEFILLRNRFVIALIFIIIFFVPIFFFLKNKFLINNSIIIDKINKEEDIVILVTEEQCDSCKQTEKVLNKDNVTYQILNVNKEKDYYQILKKLNLSIDEIVPPTVIYIEKGNVVATTLETEENDLEIFIENYNLRRFEG